MAEEALVRRAPQVEGEREPRDLAREAELHPTLPDGPEERFAGWGVMGVPFQSGDVLAMRRFSASSIGEGYTTVWHRTPSGAWTIWSDRPPLQACPRYFGSALTRALPTDIELRWEGPRRLRVRVPSAALAWELDLETSGATRVLNAMASALPNRAWRSAAVLGAMSRMAGPLLRAGRLGLRGHTPNGQTFISNPMRIWLIGRSAATLEGRDFGPQQALPTQTRLGDFWIPQRGLFAIGRAFFEPADPARHRLVETAPSQG